jgi:ubiquinol-cytochrome c reductase cytochrome c subunit
MRRRGWLLALAVLAGGLAVQLAHPAASSGQSGGSTQLDRGRTLYQANCASCHGQQGEGGNRGPRLAGAGAAAADYWLSTGRMPIAVERRDPPRKQPAFSRPDIDALAAYVASFGAGPGIPVVDPQAGDVVEGNRLYQVNCAACHSATGAGYTLQSGRAAPSIKQATPTQVAEAVRTGPGTMPQFGADLISGPQLDSVTRYVQALQAPVDRGGASLGRVGPTTEALVGWVIGLGVLVLVARGLGERAPRPRKRKGQDG